MSVGAPTAQQVEPAKAPPATAWIDIFRPNRAVSASTMKIVVAVQVGLALLIWWLSPWAVLPKPPEVLAALARLWTEEGLGRELITSFGMNLEALALVFGGGRPLKLSLLVFGVTVFFVTSMAAVVAEIPKSAFDHARTLRMTEWQVVWDVVIRGTLDKAIEALRQNAAMGWMMLTMVEGIARSEGGVGALLLNQNKHFHLAEVFAIQILILFVGLVQDYGIGVLKRVVCPWADLTLERR